MSQSGTYGVRLRPELLDDVAAGHAWYEAQAQGIGSEFVRAFYAAVAGAARQPTVLRRVYADFRRVRLRRFPHSLYYRIEEKEVVFFLLYHASRNPGSLRHVLRRRRDG